MKNYNLSYTFNGVSHVVEITNEYLTTTLHSLFLTGKAGKLENVTFYAK